MKKNGIVPDIKINKEERWPESNTLLRMIASNYKTIEEQCTVNGKLDVDKYWFYEYVNGSFNNQNSTVWKSLIKEPPHHYPKRYFLRMGLNGEPRSMPFLSKNSIEEYIDYGFTEWKEIE